MSLNSRILSLFPSEKHPEGSSEYLATRSQLLSIFYLNFVLTLLMALFEIGAWFFLPLPVSRFLTFICILGSVFSLILLKEGCPNLAGGIILLYVHIVNSMTTHILNAPMAGIFGTICYINLSTYLTRSSKIIAINSFASLVELSLHVSKVFHIFRNTLDDDQSIQIWSGSIALFVTFGYLSGMSFFQKVNLSSLWYMVQEQCETSQSLKKEVSHAHKSQKVLVSSLSEEVKNTMKSLNLGVDYLLTVLKDSNSTNVLQNLKVSGESLLNLINNTLDAAKIQTNTLKLSYQEAGIEEIVKKALNVNSESLKEKSIFAQVLIDKDMPSKLIIDPTRMFQVILNLLCNAIKFTPRNGHIILRASWHEQEGKLSVQDVLNVEYSNEHSRDFSMADSLNLSVEEFSGTGLRSRFATSQEFSPEEGAIRQRNLFALQRSMGDRFKSSSLDTTSSESWVIKKVQFSQNANQQGSRDSSFLSGTQGAGYLKIQVSDTGMGMMTEKLEKVFKLPKEGSDGIGLWICKQLAMKMSGDMIVNSELGRGTDFVLCIPTFYPKSNNYESRQVKEELKALIVDDFQSNRMLHKLMLEKNGVKVEMAVDGKQAIEMFTRTGSKRFDFILMDVIMPEMDGFEAAKKIREWERIRNVKQTDIYFVTGGYFAGQELNNIYETIGAGNKAGLRMLSKPVEMHTVESILAEQKGKF